jgi:hypothetical protein
MGLRVSEWVKPHGNRAIILMIPLWQRGMEGDFKNKCFHMING